MGNVVQGRSFVLVGRECGRLHGCDAAPIVVVVVIIVLQHLQADVAHSNNAILSKPRPLDDVAGNVSSKFDLTARMNRGIYSILIGQVLTAYATMMLSSPRCKCALAIVAFLTQIIIHPVVLRKSYASY